MAEQKATNITWHEGYVTRQEREQLLGQKGVDGLDDRPVRRRQEHDRGDA